MPLPFRLFAGLWDIPGRAWRYHDRCDRLLGKLTRRVEHLRKDLTPQEKENPSSLRDEFQQQRDEIHERIKNESEQILRLRDKIEGFGKLFEIDTI